MKKGEKVELVLLKYCREVIALLAITGAIFLGTLYPEQYKETAKGVLIAAISGYLGISQAVTTGTERNKHTDPED